MDFYLPNTSNYRATFARKIEIIKFVRMNTSCGLMEAKNAVEWVVAEAEILETIDFSTFLKLLSLMLSIATDLTKGTYVCEGGAIFSEKEMFLTDLRKLGIEIKNSSDYPNIKIVQRKRVEFADLMK